MKNAKEEFIKTVAGEAKLICAEITIGKSYYDESNRNTYRLKKGHTLEDLEKFLESIDIKYDDGYGGQELYGTIWFEDGTWAERGEYDGSEWWEIKKCPEIPNELL